MFTRTKSSWLHLWYGVPGTRFQDFHRRVQLSNSGNELATRIARLLMAFVFFAIAACLLIFPLVHVPFFLASAALIAAESPRLARAMDRGEAWTRASWNDMLSRYGVSGASVNVAVMALGLGCIIVTGCVCYGRFLR